MNIKEIAITMPSDLLRMMDNLSRQKKLSSAKLFLWLFAISSTLKFGELPGRVVLQKGGANMSRKCVVNVTQIKSVDKQSLREKIGALSRERMTEVYDGIKPVMSIPGCGTEMGFDFSSVS